MQVNCCGRGLLSLLYTKSLSVSLYTQSPLVLNRWGVATGRVEGGMTAPWCVWLGVANGLAPSDSLSTFSAQKYETY